MKILFVGNSQTSFIKKEHDINPEILSMYAKGYFYMTPSGTGPFIIIEDSTLRVIKGTISPNFLNRAPPDVTKEIPVDRYDVIVASVLGYVDGGIYYVIQW